MTVPLLNLHAQFDSIKDEVEGAIHRVLNTQQFILGEEVSEFERELALSLESKYALGVSSGTDALILALLSLGIGEGDEVITTTYSFFATAGSIVRVGAKPVFVDIEYGSFNIDSDQIEKAITPKTRAIIPVHLFGQSANLNRIKEIASANKIYVVEDCAQAQGAKYYGQNVGTLGDVGCFSFFPSKNLGCMGDGGAVSCQQPELMELLASLRGHGMNSKVKYLHEYVGGNFRIDALQAAILRVKLPHLESWIEKRRENAKKYTLLFDQAIGAQDGDNPIVLPKEEKGCFHTYNQFVLRVPFREKLLERATEKNIGMMVYYPYPLHRQPCFSSLAYGENSLPVSEKACRESVAIPIYPELPYSDMEKVVDVIVSTGKEEGYLK